MSSSTTTNTLLPAPAILEATGTSGIKLIEVDKLASSGATLDIPASAIKSGDRVRAWSISDSGTVIDEVKTVAAIPLTFSVAKDKLKKGTYPTFSYALLDDKDKPTAVSAAVPYSVV